MVSLGTELVTVSFQQREIVMHLQGRELLKSIQKRCRIQPGMLVRSDANEDERQPPVISLVLSLSPACKFDRDYPEAEEHIFYVCQPMGDAPRFVNYACNLAELK